MRTKADRTKRSNFFASFHIYLVAIVVFLLPLKFGSVVGVPEVPFFWDDPVLWILESHPPILFPLVACIVFISSFIANKYDGFLYLDKSSFLSLSWLILAIASLIGFLNASVPDFPIIFSLHFFGLAIFAIAISITLKLRDDVDNILIRALILGTSVSLFFSLHQLLWGFKSSIEFIRQQEAKTGIAVSRDLWLRIEQTRVFAPFSICNSLGAHIILMLPILTVGVLYDKKLTRLTLAISAFCAFILFFNNYGKTGTILAVLIFSFILSLVLTSFYDEHWEKICVIFAIIFSLFTLYILKHTFSRGAVLSLGLAIFATLFLLKLPKKIKIIALIISLTSIILFLIAVNQKRSLLEQSSLHARLDYWLCAAEIFFKNPLFGTGWGDFFHEYTIIKRFPGTEAPHSAHNIVMDFASQCGIFGLIAISGLLFGTILFTARLAINDDAKSFCRFSRLAIFCGLLAWFLHSLTDINFQVPGTIATAIVLSLAATNKNEGFKIRLPFANFAITLLLVPLLFFCVKRLKFEFYFERLHRICDPIIIDENNPGKYSFQSMESALRATVSAGSYSPYPWASAGNYTQSRGLWRESEIFFSEALKRSPERASFYQRLANSQLRLGKFEEAMNNLKKASELFPNDKESFNQYQKLKKITEGKNEAK